MTRRFITPSNDLVFKKTFTDAENTHILIHLIEDFTGLVVTDIHIDHPYNFNNLEEFKTNERLEYTAVDIYAKLQDGTGVIIELQVAKELQLAERNLYYFAKKYADNYSSKKNITIEKDKYSSLRPVYQIIILYENYFDDDLPIHTFRYRCDETGEKLLDSRGQEDSMIIFLELHKPLDKLSELLRDWFLYFLARELSKEAPKYIVDAQKVSEYVNLKKEERAVLIDIEKRRADSDTFIARVKLNTRAETQAEERKKFEVESKRKNQERARKMLAKGYDLEDISEITDLSVSEIEKLR
ncbi:Rpn family recombination-promoting nuclease/putative transposase [Xylocopilactobacillus apicola]|uniref:Rpn family recombination-promoting nuclease/putative transposase n=1 Tax=Xylocopilactobacillus apicola TaxID=2932184 RepID=A0AAU9DQY0_9LACO|nr:Rpn family recombination-promoting nuclease/putative transposase [Xylocopilactobacillus apicola]BDR59607.1 hypothetical protein XA3_20480 [Xylocopilactobacillus apicola]